MSLLATDPPSILLRKPRCLTVFPIYSSDRSRCPFNQRAQQRSQHRYAARASQVSPRLSASSRLAARGFFGADLERVRIPGRASFSPLTINAGTGQAISRSGIEIATGFTLRLRHPSLLSHTLRGKQSPPMRSLRTTVGLQLVQIRYRPAVAARDSASQCGPDVTHRHAFTVSTNARGRLCVPRTGINAPRVQNGKEEKRDKREKERKREREGGGGGGGGGGEKE